MQRGHHFAIVDEVDSILIDEARTPLIISGAGTQAADTYKKFARVMPGLKEGVDFDMDEAKRTINATESGLEKIEVMLGIENIYADPSGQLANHLQQALKAQFLFHRDVDYVVMDGEVKIVDEFTGRIMEGRRYSEGLHQALEAKEHVLVREENQTLATITLPELLPPLRQALRHDRYRHDRGRGVPRRSTSCRSWPFRPIGRSSASTRTIWCTAPSTASSTPWPTTSPRATRRASRA